MASNEDIYHILGVVEGKITAMSDTVAHINKVLIIGNGKLPITAQVQDLQDQCSECKTEKEKEKASIKTARKTRWEAWTAIIVAVIMAIASLVVGLSAGGTDATEERILQILIQQQNDRDAGR